MNNPAHAPISGYDGSADNTLQQYWLDVAWRALQGEDRSLVARVETGDLEPETVADVVTAAARRVLRNPGGVEQEAGALDDYSESATYKDATEDIYFTTAEMRRLASASAALTGFTGSIKYCG